MLSTQWTLGRSRSKCKLTSFLNFFPSFIHFAVYQIEFSRCSKLTYEEGNLLNRRNQVRRTCQRPVRCNMSTSKRLCDWLKWFGNSPLMAGERWNRWDIFHEGMHWWIDWSQKGRKITRLDILTAALSGWVTSERLLRREIPWFKRWARLKTISVDHRPSSTFDSSYCLILIPKFHHICCEKWDFLFAISLQFHLYVGSLSLNFLILSTISFSLFIHKKELKSSIESAILKVEILK